MSCNMTLQIVELRLHVILGEIQPLATGSCPSFGTTPALGLWPKMPQKAEGMRMEPPTSDLYHNEEGYRDSFIGKRA